MSEAIRKKALVWTQGSYDAATKAQVADLLANNEKELIECFYTDLEFGTGGLRGIMGVGTNRMNIYTVGAATQGLCNYVRKSFPDMKEPRAAIAHDSRNNSRLFAETVAQIFSANGIRAFMFDSLRPTPELSFAIRELGCQAGVVITASHNPKEYNGYKAYWNDGGQLVPPHDKNVITEVRAIQSVDEINFKGNSNLIETLGEKFDTSYIEMLKSLSLSPDMIKRQKNMKIVYTPIHGTGVKLAPQALRAYGFESIYNVAEQDVSDGNFPTVKSPNPENADALAMAIEKAKEVGAELVLATDPDADRVGIAVLNDKNEFVLLNGNQTGSILLYYLLHKWKENGKLTGKEYVVKTIVTTELIAEMAQSYGVEYYDVLTGFKYIAEVMKENEGKKTFIGGGEESYGYLAGEAVRDKDAIMSCALIAEAVAWAKDQGISAFGLLVDMYQKFNFYKEDLVNVVKTGKDGAEAIQKMMADYRSNTPTQIAGTKVVEVKDYETGVIRNLITGKETKIDMPASNVLQFVLEDGAKISVRPSGTEPKIKFYFGVKTKLESADQFYATEQKLNARIKELAKALDLV